MHDFWHKSMVLSLKTTHLEYLSKIGATIGAETKHNAMMAFLYSTIAILIYITFRFEWRFGASCDCVFGA